MFLFSSGKYLGVELADYMIVLFLIFFRNLHTVFHSGCTNLHSHQQYMRVPSSLQPWQHLLFVVFLIIAILRLLSNRSEVIAHFGLICIYLLVSDVEHLFMFFLTICVFSLEKRLFRSSAYLWIGFFLIFSCMNCL